LHIQQRHVDVLAEAGALAVGEGGEHAYGRIDAGHQIGEGDADLLRTAARQVVAGRPGRSP
jgi:hypothetical protein